MRYIELRQAMGPFTIFSLSDIKRLFPSFHRRRLNEWQDKGYLTKVIKGYYVFSEIKMNEDRLFEIANRIYDPSYVSFETALSYHGLIPESVYAITSASTRRTYTFRTAIGEFAYRTLTPRLFFGYEIVRRNAEVFKLACPEKALLDYFYINERIRERDDFEALRIDRDIFSDRVDYKKIPAFLRRFNNKRLAKRIKIFLEVVRHA